jgi:hypothetical protein
MIAVQLDSKSSIVVGSAVYTEPRFAVVPAVKIVLPWSYTGQALGAEVRLSVRKENDRQTSVTR